MVRYTVSEATISEFAEKRKAAKEKAENADQSGEDLHAGCECSYQQGWGSGFA